MKNLISIILLLSIADTNAAVIHDYQSLRQHLLSGESIRVVLNQEKCNGLKSSHIANFKPKTWMITDNLIASNDKVLTNQDPNAQGELAYEMINYLILPFHGRTSSYECEFEKGCLVMKTNAYKYSNGDLLSSYPLSYCAIDSSVTFTSS